MQVNKKGCGKMERLRLRKWVKVLLTAIVIIISLLVYLSTGKSSYNIEVIKWLWLIGGQMISYSLIWE